MNTTFLLSGGAGRVICAIPALEKYHRLNPDDDFKVLIPGWEMLYWDHPMLHNRTYGIGQKGIFDLIVKNSKLVSPEPYHRHSYYNQLSSMVEAYDEEINGTSDHSDLDSPKLYCHTSEIQTAKHFITTHKKQKNKKKFVVYQPYGSSAMQSEFGIIDPSNRSLCYEDAVKIGRLISNDAVVLYFGVNEFLKPSDNYMINSSSMPGADLRFFMAMISQCDYFIGIDSVGQHIAKSFDKPGTVILGSTFEKNISYPGHFNFIRNGKPPIYNPIRIGGMDCNLVDRANDGLMRFSDDQIAQVYSNFKKFS